MAKTIIEFNLPYSIIDEGTYEVSLDGKLAKITIEKEMRSQQDIEKIMGWKISTTGGGKVEMYPDSHGVSSFSKIKIEWSYYFKNISRMEFMGNFEKMIEVPSVKEECVKYLNRLIDVLRFKTNQYWIQPILEQDILQYQHEGIDDSGKPQQSFVMDMGAGVGYPLQTIKAEKVKSEILDMLKNEKVIPFFNKYLLDGIRYFNSKQFNDVVITINIGLEILIKKYTEMKARENGIHIDQVKSLHKFLRKQFPKVFHSSLIEDNPTLWEKFDYVRDGLRTKAVHYGQKITPNEAYQCIEDSKEVVSWVMNQKERSNTSFTPKT